MLAAFLHGFLLALALILPLGPQNTFVMSQGAANERYRDVVPVVIVASLSDTMLIAVAVSGVSLALLALPVLKIGLTILGIVFLGWMGVQSWRAPVDHGETRLIDPSTAAWPLRKRVRYSLSVSLLNPHAIMDTIVVIGGGAALYSHEGEKLAYGLAAILVSWTWFFALSLTGRAFLLLRNRARALTALNRGSAIIMWAIAAKYLVQSIQLWVP